MWGPTGWTRLFNDTFGNMMSWLLPGALVMGAVLLVLTIRARRTDRERAALLLWGGSLAAIGLTISLAQGIIHPYYTVALAAPLGGLVGIATMGLWERRATWAGRVGLAAGLAATVVWSAVLLGRTSNWFPALRPFVVAAGALGVVAILALPLLHKIPKLAVGLVVVLGLGAALAAPLFSTVATAATPHNGAIPSVTPTPAGGQGGPGGGGGFPGGFAGRGTHRAFGGFPGGGGRSGGFPGGGFPGAAPAPAPAPAPVRPGPITSRWDRRRRAVVRQRLGAARLPSGRRRRRRSRRRVLQLRASPNPGAHEGAAVGRRPLHVGRGHVELQQRSRLPIGEWSSRSWRSAGSTGPTRPPRWRSSRSTSEGKIHYFIGGGSTVPAAASADSGRWAAGRPTTHRRSRRGSSPTSRQRRGRRHHLQRDVGRIVSRSAQRLFAPPSFGRVRKPSSIESKLKATLDW